MLGHRSSSSQASGVQRSSLRHAVAPASRRVALRVQAADGPSTSGAQQQPSSQPSQAQHGWQHVIGMRAGALGTLGVASSWALFPALHGTANPMTLLGGGGNNGSHGGNGGSGGDGGAGGAGEGGFGQHQSLFDLAAADEKDKEPTSDVLSEEVVKEEPKDEKWKELITPSDEVEEVPGQRVGTNRCVEIVIEGWPEVGALPKMVREGRGRQLGGAQLGCGEMHEMT